MRQITHTCYSVLLAAMSLQCVMSCTGGKRSTVEDSPLAYIDTRIGTARSATHTAGRFGKHTEEYGQTLPAVLEPNGMNFWTPQTRDTELKGVHPYMA
jgi:putative alpha-1,2-mannosidase